MKISLYLKRYFLSLLAVVLLANLNALQAQGYSPKKLKITASAISDGTDIIIRWMPADYETFKWGNEYGYRLERMRVDTGATSMSHVVIDSTIMVLPDTQWQSLKDTNDMAKVAYTLIFEDSLEAQYLTGSDFTTIYEAKKARESVVMFLTIATSRDLDAAIASGLAYIDTTAEAGANYIYFIKPNNVPTTTELEKGMCEIATDNAYLLPPLIGLTAQGGDSVAVVGWYGDPENYISYLIERSDDNGATWQQVNENPFISSLNEGDNYLTYGDSLSSNNTDYIYRVKGCSAFGLIGPVSDTVHVIGMPGPLEDGHPNVIDIEELNTGELTINWEFPSSSESDIQGYDIYRSNKQEGHYEKLNTSMLATSARAYTDTDPLSSNYYKVVVVQPPINQTKLQTVKKMVCNRRIFVLRQNDRR